MPAVQWAQARDEPQQRDQRAVRRAARRASSPHRAYRRCLAAAQREALGLLAAARLADRPPDAGAAALDAAPARAARSRVPRARAADGRDRSARPIVDVGRPRGRPTDRDRLTSRVRSSRSRRGSAPPRPSTARWSGSSARPRPADAATTPAPSWWRSRGPQADREPTDHAADHEQRRGTGRSSGGARAAAPCRRASATGSSARRSWRTSASNRSQSRAAMNHCEPRLASSATPSR